ncbi:MAG: hypothetical protein FWC16_12265 [Defluviitaleaceae bacterium]|nr:hypothetical protein [Defluviitaleaceae bacterium]MCL2275694.1 hypothetical protein [Defluviitaleaceae bacterium]
MKTEKKIWLIDRYAQKLWTLSTTLRQEAARAGEHGRGYAMVAHEARLVANTLEDLTARLLFDNGESDLADLAKLALQLKFLSVNAYLETIHGVKKSMEFNIPKSMAVFTDDLRTIANALEALTDNFARQAPIPELAQPLKAESCENFLLFKIGDRWLIENMYNIAEVSYQYASASEAPSLTLRGVEIPIINVHKKLHLTAPPTRFNIAPEGETWRPVIIFDLGEKNWRAIPIDDLTLGLLYSPKGTPVTPDECHPFHAYIRECWELVGGERVVFVDWDGLKD